MNTPAMPRFTRPTFTEEQMSAARRVRDTFIDMTQGIGAYAGREIDDEGAELAALEDYDLALPALGAMLSFGFPRQTHGNDVADPNTTLDDPVGELCVSIMDPRPDADNSLYMHTLISPDQWEELGLEAIDEWHFEFIDKDQTVRQAVQRLLDIGLDYNPDNCAHDEEEKCMFREVLGEAIAAASVGSGKPSGSGHKP